MTDHASENIERLRLLREARERLTGQPRMHVERGDGGEELVEFIQRCVEARHLFRPLLDLLEAVGVFERMDSLRAIGDPQWTDAVADLLAAYRDVLQAEAQPAAMTLPDETEGAN